MSDSTIKGTIFNIQKFSVNDGPGIRTTVFFKGCPLHCGWCSNPESQSVLPQIGWTRRSCVGCQKCVQTCPQQAITYKEGSIRIDHHRCVRCQTCVKQCPTRSLKQEGQLMSVEEVMKEVIKDKDFYDESGGGMTLSGGEMLMQSDFAIALLKAAHKEGIHTCCETTGHISRNIFKKIIPYFDTMLYDMKHYDTHKHHLGTGVGNELILSNLKYAIDEGKDVLIRIPVIPGFNDSLIDAAGFAEAIKAVGATSCQLLPFHQFGENKYDMLGRDYMYQSTTALHKEDLIDYINVFKEHHVDAFL